MRWVTCRNLRPIFLTCCACAVALMVCAGCSNTAKERQAKRDEDRTALRLAAAENENDQLRTQLQQTQGQLKDAQQRATDAESQLAQTSQSLHDTQDQLAAVKAKMPTTQPTDPTPTTTTAP
jgi:peptidoglycan hydrolase CwlO-like protein